MIDVVLLENIEFLLHEESLAKSLEIVKSLQELRNFLLYNIAILVTIISDTNFRNIDRVNTVLFNLK